ncbi:MAG: outer membrane protein assembly factor BamA [Rhodovarius sp.]|nr:outer membrane protein assembly factor BamA [Rhodovarius sp.]
MPPLRPTLRILLLASACWMLLAAPSAEAQQRRAPAAAAQPAGVISAVEVRGNQRIEADTVRSYMLLQPGDAYDPDRADRSLRALFATGLFRDVQIARDGSRLIVQVQENPIVNRVAFEGNRRISDDNIRPEVQLRPRGVFTEQLAQADRQRILDLYARRGRFAASVEPRVIELDQNRVDVVFEITEGEQARIARINFVGNRGFSDSRLRDVISSRESAFYRFFSSADLYDPDRLAFDRELLRRFYLRQGYADVEVGAATAELSPDRTAFFITFQVNEGTRYRIGRLEVTTDFAGLDTALLRRRLEISEGDWYDGDAVERATQALADAANLRGFPFVDVQPRITRNTEAGTIDIVFHVAQGPRIFVERIEITGNTRTQDRVIRREFRLAEGDAFNAAQIRRSRERIRNLGYFADVSIEAQPGSAPDRAVINTTVQERATGEVSLGGGYSTDAGFLVDVGLRERNLVGTGIDARLGGTLAQRRSQVDISITDPAFLDRNLGAGFDIFLIQRNLLRIASYEERRVGFALRIGYEFNERLRQGWSYTLVDRNVYNVQPFASTFVRDQAGRTLLSQVSQTIAFDTRDSLIEPRSGYVIRYGIDVAGAGGDVFYLRNRVDGMLLLPLERLFGHQDYVLALMASWGHLMPYGSRRFPNGERDRIVDRFFLGGENLRGFAIAGVGPRDATTLDSLGGRLIWTASAEMRYPLPLPSELGLLGRAFVDAGALTQGPRGPGVLSSAHPRVSVGVGVSWRSPFGLINIDLARAVVKEPFDQTQVFRFGFGTRF